MFWLTQSQLIQEVNHIGKVPFNINKTSCDIPFYPQVSSSVKEGIIQGMYIYEHEP